MHVFTFSRHQSHSFPDNEDIEETAAGEENAVGAGEVAGEETAGGGVSKWEGHRELEEWKEIAAGETEKGSRGCAKSVRHRVGLIL